MSKLARATDMAGSCRSGLFVPEVRPGFQAGLHSVSRSVTPATRAANVLSRSWTACRSWIS
jgi:hypothetical protein